MNQYDDAFDMYLAHKGVVVAAVKRLGYTPHTALFEDLVEEGMLIYLEYFRKYRDPLDSEEAVRKFNRLAGFNVFYTLLNWQRQARRREEITADHLGAQPQVSAELPIPDDAFDVADVLDQLVPDLTLQEKQVLEYLYGKDLTVTQTATRMDITRYQVRNARRRIAAKYRKLMG